MRKILKWALIILILVIVISFIVNGVLYMNYKRNIKTGSVSYDSKINSIYVNQDIPVRFREGNRPHVYYHVNKNDVPYIKDTGHVLSLVHSSRYRSHSILGSIHISLNGIRISDPEYITVVLPKNHHHISTLSSNGGTNDLYLSNLNIRNVKLNTMDGDIHLSNFKANNIKVSSSDGDIYLSHLKANSVRAFSSDGDLHLSNIGTKKAFAYSNDGDIHLSNIVSNSLIRHTNDGDVYTHSITK